MQSTELIAYRLQSLPVLVAVDDDEFHVRVVQNECDIVGPVIDKQRHGHQSLRERPLISYHPIDTVFQHDGDTLARLQSFTAQSFAHARDAVARFTPIDAAPFFRCAIAFAISRRVGRTAATQRKHVRDGRGIVEHQVTRAVPVLQDR